MTAALLLWVGVAAGRSQDPLIFVQEPLDGSEPGTRLVLLQDGRSTLLTAGFHAAADPCVAFDATRVLFAGKRHAAEPWAIWEMDVDGSRKRRVFVTDGDCREPAYLAMAAVDPPEFRDRVRWMSCVCALGEAVDERGRGLLTSLFAVSIDPVPGRGQVVWRATYGLGGDLAPAVLADGRVAFSSWQRQGYALMTISWAGENLNPLFGSHDDSLSQLSPAEITADRRVVFVERAGEARDRSGSLAAISLQRPLHSRMVLSRDGGAYRTPQWWPGSGIVVAHRAAGNESYGLFLFDEGRGRPGRRLHDDPQWHDVDPQPVAVRPEPVGRIPMTEFASVLDIGGFERAGQLQCLNVYDSDRSEAAGLRPGDVARVRLVEGLPLTPTAAARLKAAGGPADRAWPPPFVDGRSLGEAPVEPDGSFYVNVPGDVPFYIEALDAQGRVLVSMRAWTWVRSGDQRGCVGCHEDKELAPVNRATQALIRARPLNLMGPRGQAGPGSREGGAE